MTRKLSLAVSLLAVLFCAGWSFQALESYFKARVHFSHGDGIVALIGGGCTGATQLRMDYNDVITSASNGDSVKLPLPDAGSVIYVKNDDASHSLAVCPGTGASIDGGTATTGTVSIPHGTSVTFYGQSGTAWSSTLAQCNMTGAATATTLSTTGNITDGGSLSVATTTTLTGNSTEAGTFGVTGLTTLSGGLNETGTVAVTGAETVSTTLGVTGITTATGGLTLGTAGPLNMGAPQTPTAGATQTQAGATALTNNWAVVTVGNAGDGVILPAEAAGRKYTVCAAHATNTLKLYCIGACKVNNATNTTGVTVTASSCVDCLSDGTNEWCTKL